MPQENMRPIDLLFLDLDGTLIGHTGQVRDQIWPAIDRMRDDGIILSICTGRPYGGVAAEVATRLGDETVPHIYTGGALTCNSRGALIHAETVPEELVTRMVERARDERLTLELYTSDTIFVDAQTDFSTRHANLLGMTSQERDLIEVAAEFPIIKTQWILSHKDAPGIFATPLPGCHGAIGTSDVMPDVTFITVTRDGIDKGSACRRVAKSLGVPLARVGAVGDSTGDIPMFEGIGMPYVMGNSPQSMLDAYPTLPSIEEDGILELARILLGP